MLERIYVDFNTMNQDLWSKSPRVLIGKDEERPLTHKGRRVLIVDEILEVEATLEYDSKHGVWWARPNWSTRRDLPYSEVADYGSRAV